RTVAGASVRLDPADAVVHDVAERTQAVARGRRSAHRRVERAGGAGGRRGEDRADAGDHRARARRPLLRGRGSLAPVPSRRAAQAAVAGVAVRSWRGRVHAGVRGAPGSAAVPDVGARVARVRLFAALRDIAGERELDVPGATPREIVQTLTDKF